MERDSECHGWLGRSAVVAERSGLTRVEFLFRRNKPTREANEWRFSMDLQVSLPVLRKVHQLSVLMEVCTVRNLDVEERNAG